MQKSADYLLWDEFLEAKGPWLFEWRSWLQMGDVIAGSKLGRYLERDLYNLDEVPFQLEHIFKKMNHSEGNSQNLVQWLSCTIDVTKRFATLIPLTRADGYPDSNFHNSYKFYASRENYLN